MNGGDAHSYFWLMSMLFFSMQFDEQKDHVTIERILRVVFLDPERSTPVSIKQNTLSFCLLFLVMHADHR